MASVISNTLFAEDSPLAGAWLAANAVDKRLSKQSKEKMLSVPISQATRAIERLTQSGTDGSGHLNDSEQASQYAFATQDLQEEPKLPLRLSSQLLYGVVRIYSSKATTLHGEVSQELKQIKRVFTVNKNITMDPRESNPNDVLKDQMTMENLIHSVDEFNIDEIFGEVQPAAGVDAWTQQSSYESTAVSDVDVGRNADESMVSSIDDVPRRAELERRDDLDGADELDLDLNLEKEAGTNADADLDLPDFSVPDFGDDNSAIDANDFDGGFDMPLEELEEQADARDTISAYVEEVPVRRNPRRRAAEKITVEYRINNVVRTKARKLLVDPRIDKTAADIRANQAKFEINLKLQRLNSSKVCESDNQMVRNIFKSLQPELLSVMGTNWRALKKRKLENGMAEVSEGNNYEMEDPVPNFDVGEVSGPAESIDFDVPELEPEHQSESLAIDADDEEEALDEESDQDEFELIKTSNKSSIKIAQCLRDENVVTTKLNDIVDKDILSSNKRKNATRTFFEMLVLATADTVALEQSRLYGDIKVVSKPSLYQKFL